MAATKGDSAGVPSFSDAFEAIRILQLNVQSIDARLKRVEEAGLIFWETQKKMDDKLDGIHQLLTQWTSSSELGSTHKLPRPVNLSPSPSPQFTTLTPDELALLKKQEPEGKISQHPDPFLHTTHTTQDTLPNFTFTTHDQ
jgi:hypothetical protein